MFSVLDKEDMDYEDPVYSILASISTWNQPEGFPRRVDKLLSKDDEWEGVAG